MFLKSHLSITKHNNHRPMKVPVAVLLLMMLIVGGPTAFCQDGPAVAFVAAGGVLDDGYDLAFHGFIVDLGYTVTIIDSANVGGSFDKAAAETYDLVVYSESPGSGSIDPLASGGLPDVPLIHCEGFGWDNLGLFGGSPNWINNSETASEMVTAVGAAHPIFQEAGVAAGAFSVYATPSGSSIATNAYTAQDSPVAGVEVLITAGTTAPLVDAPIMWIIEGGVVSAAPATVVGLGTPHGAPQNLASGSEGSFTDFSAGYLAVLEATLNYLAPVGPPPPPPLEIAGDLLVDVSAADASAGTATWVNNGTLGDFDFVTTGTLPAGSSSNLVAGALGTNLVVDTFEGVPVVNVMSGAGNYAAYAGPASPATITGGDDRSIEAWVADESAPSAQVIIAWGRRGSDGVSEAFSYGTRTTFGACIHWGDPFDVPWGNNFDAGELPDELPTTGTLHHLVYTYENSTVKLYIDGQLVVTNVMGAIPPATTPASPLATEPGMNINLFIQNNNATGALSNNSLPGSLLVNSIRVHSGVLSDAQVLANFQRGPDGGGGGGGPVNSAKTWLLY